MSWADGPGAYVKVAVSVGNTTGCAAPGGVRDHVTRRSLVAVHTLLAVDDGAFVSLLDPPPAAAEAADGCTSVGTYPVLVGDGSAEDVVLSSPIILYDHPAVAPESQGDMCDATEIDEILALRVLTLTDEEKAEARGTDARAAAIVDRWEDMPPEVWERLHGTVRSIGPAVTARPEPEPVPWWEPARGRRGRSLVRRAAHRRRRRRQGHPGAAATVAASRRARHVRRRHGCHGGRRVPRRGR